MFRQQPNVVSPAGRRRVARWLVVPRVVLSVGVAFALPFSQQHWGASCPSMGLVLLFMVIGWLAAMLFVALGSLAQFLLRRQRPRVTVLVDVLLFLALAGALSYAGVTARYSDADTSPSTKGQ